MHARLLACTRRPEMLRGLTHAYIPQRCFSQSTFLLKRSKKGEPPAEGKKTTPKGPQDIPSKLQTLERRLWWLVKTQPKGPAENPSQSKTEKQGAAKTENNGDTKAEINKLSKDLKAEIAAVRKWAEGETTAVRKFMTGVSAQNEMIKRGLATANDRNKELVAELKLLFKQSTWPLHCKAALLKQVAKTLLAEASHSSTASIPGMLLSNRDRYSEVGLSSPEQLDWISTQWKSLIDEQKVEVKPLSLLTIFTTLKYLEREEKTVYHLLFQHFSGKPSLKWLKNSTQEEKEIVLVP